MQAIVGTMNPEHIKNACDILWRWPCRTMAGMHCIWWLESICHNEKKRKMFSGYCFLYPKPDTKLLCSIVWTLTSVILQHIQGFNSLILGEGWFLCNKSRVYIDMYNQKLIQYYAHESRRTLSNSTFSSFATEMATESFGYTPEKICYLDIGHWIEATTFSAMGPGTFSLCHAAMTTASSFGIWRFTSWMSGFSLVLLQWKIEAISQMVLSLFSTEVSRTSLKDRTD